MFDKDWYWQQLSSFNEQFSLSDSCIQLIDWGHDFGVPVEDAFELRFYRRKLIERAMISYVKTGEYIHLPVRQEGFRLVKEANEKSNLFHFWAWGWHDAERRFLLSCTCPGANVGSGSFNVYDFSLNRDDALIWFRPEIKFPGSSTLLERTRELVESRYQALSRTVIQRNYKTGWLFYRLQEDIPEVTELWAKHGYYYSLSSIASEMTSQFMRDHRPDEWQKRINGLLMQQGDW